MTFFFDCQGGQKLQVKVRLAVKAEEKQSHRENHSLYSNSGFLQDYIHTVINSEPLLYSFLFKFN